MFLCKRKGHYKANCLMNSKNKQKDISLAFVNFEPHLFDVQLNSWWMGTGASLHVMNLSQGV